MSGKIHRCNEEPVQMTIAWSQWHKSWMFSASTFNDEASYMFDATITYCPYCGEKLKGPEEDD